MATKKPAGPPGKPPAKPAGKPGKAETGSPFYQSQDVKIPTGFPEVLKQFTKAAIRTQPPDLMPWAAQYFKAMANGEEPPIKDVFNRRPITNSSAGLTFELLQKLHEQLSGSADVEEKDLASKWGALGLDKAEMDTLLEAAGLSRSFPWRNFVALAAISMAPSLEEAMVILIRLMTTEPKDKPPAIPFGLFRELCVYLTYLVPDPTQQERTEASLQYLGKVGADKGCMVTPADLKHPDCPKLT